ncbi:hypothetical protein [Blastococcus sp. LR1]|uniref:hypothetical protein n=1 Tax=Blastococcus sp. LR1 TaxID=2877000 RepID=UPI001CCBB464|nr:hypothetical protein [Blastococcus sp. LR1]MCA0146740.1 hypothetical protein [Blastococcus sp. LR1]
MLVAVVAGVVLSGCSEKQEASDTVPTAAAETTDSLPPLGPKDFPVPDEARTKDAAGAEAFLRYYVELLNRQRELLDGQPIRALGPDCQGCLRIARTYDETAAAAARYVGGELSLNDVTEPRLDGDEATVGFGLRQAAVKRVDAEGQPIDDGLPEIANIISGITLAYSAEVDSWLVEALDLG